jgi:hypothetical protein
MKKATLPIIITITIILLTNVFRQQKCGADLYHQKQILIFGRKNLIDSNIF